MPITRAVFDSAVREQRKKSIQRKLTRPLPRGQRAKWARGRGIDPLAELLRDEPSPAADYKALSPTDQQAVREKLVSLYGENALVDFDATGEPSVRFTDDWIVPSGAGSGNGGTIYAPYVPTTSVNIPNYGPVAVDTAISGASGFAIGQVQFNNSSASTTITTRVSVPMIDPATFELVDSPGAGPMFGIGGAATLAPNGTSLETVQDLRALWGAEVVNQIVETAPLRDNPNVSLRLDVLHTNGTATPTLQLHANNGWTEENVQFALGVTARLSSNMQVVYSDGAPEDSQRAFEQARSEQKRREEEAEKRRQAAKERARKLLLMFLTPTQRMEYEQHKYFHVVTPRKHRYRIQQGRTGNILRLNRHGKPMRGFCIHPSKSVPDEDTLLAQKLLLEGNEDKFLEVANHRPARTHRMQVYSQNQISAGYTGHVALNPVTRQINGVDFALTDGGLVPTIAF